MTKPRPAIVRRCDETEARLWEISENLHRADLTVLERDEQVTEWIGLTTDKLMEESQKVSAQLAQKLGRPEGGLSAVTRELGVDRDDARRAGQVASLTPEAKSAARALGLDNNRSALLAAAKGKTPEAQVAVLKKRAEKKTRKPRR